MVGGVSIRLLRSWLYMKVSWWARVTEPITSSSPLSDVLGEAELGLVSMETLGSGSKLESDWLECGEDDGAGPGPVSSEVGSMGPGCALARLWFCSSLLFIMLFIALCISRSIRCFSRFGMRPKRTAEHPTHTQAIEQHEHQVF